MPEHLTIQIGPEMQMVVLVQRIEAHMTELNRDYGLLNKAFKAADPAAIQVNLKHLRTMARQVAEMSDKLDTLLFHPQD